MDTAKDLHMGEPVRPGQIKNIKSATLDWDGVYTITVSINCNNWNRGSLLQLRSTAVPTAGLLHYYL